MKVPIPPTPNTRAGRNGDGPAPNLGLKVLEGHFRLGAETMRDYIQVDWQNGESVLSAVIEDTKKWMVRNA